VTIDLNTTVPDEIIEEQKKVKEEALQMIKEVKKEVEYKYQVILHTLFSFTISLVCLINLVGPNPNRAFNRMMKTFYLSNLFQQFFILATQPK
jgi:ADP-heptose:LPS heptosyltransferase